MWLPAGRASRWGVGAFPKARTGPADASKTRSAGLGSRDLTLQYASGMAGNREAFQAFFPIHLEGTRPMRPTKKTLRLLAGAAVLGMFSAISPAVAAPSGV